MQFLKVFLGMLFAGSMLSGCQTFSPRAQLLQETTDYQSSQYPSFADRQKVPITLAGNELVVEVVNTSQSIQQGLSGRSEIGSDGMLFIFPTTSLRTFWMPDMQFGLDLVWIRDMEVIGVTSEVSPPQPGTAKKDLERYPSPGVVTMVLEIPEQHAAQLGISEGSQLRFD